MSDQKSGLRGGKVLGFERNIFFSGLTSFTMDTSTKMIYSVMSMFLLSIGATKTELSLIEGIAESTASLLKAFSGWWSDKIGRNKPFMVIGYALSAIVMPVYAVAVVPVHILILRFIERIGKGVRTAPRDSLIANSTEGGNTGRNFGFHKTMDNCGAIIGPLLSFAILSAFTGNYRLVFIFSAIPAFLSIFVIAGFIKEVKRNKEDLPKKIVLKDFPKRFYVFLAIVFVFTLGNSTDQLLLVKANDVGINALYIPLVYLIYNFVSVLFAIPMGMLSDRIGKEKLIIFGYSTYSILYFGFGRTGTIGIVIGLFALYGIYSAATDGVQKALVADLIDKDKRGTGLGIYNSLLGVTLLPASLIAGILYDKVNNSAPFYFGSAMALLAALMMLVFYRWKQK
jgi:MFS family permease